MNTVRETGQPAVTDPRRRQWVVSRRGFGVVLIAVAAAAAWILCESFLSLPQRQVLRPAVASTAAFAVFGWLLATSRGVEPFAEIGFIYLGVALAYTLIPVAKIIALDFKIPADYDGLNFAVLGPRPDEIGRHLWRHALFMAGAAAGFLAVRMRPLRPAVDTSLRPWALADSAPMMAFLILCCAGVEWVMSAPVSSYAEHYARFDHLPWALRQSVFFCSIIKHGGYFVLLTFLFARYQRYRVLIAVLVPALAAYEVWYSFGSRIEGFTILLAAFGLYNLRVARVSLKKGAAIMLLLAVAFSAFGVVRHWRYDLDLVRFNVADDKRIRASEFDAVFCTGFHVYSERQQGTLPPRDWRMLIYEFIAVVPLLDHTTYHPQYWYARYYYPKEPVPPTTWGVIPESGIWGGEWDLLVRSIINGALFAALTRWFLRRRRQWWVLTVYVYCYATCIMTWKYSVFYQVMPLARVLLPALLAAVLVARVRGKLSALVTLRPQAQT